MSPKHLLVAILLFFCLHLAHSQIDRPSGINLTWINYYSTEFVFTDMFKQSRELVVHNQGSNNPWNTGLTIPLNENGYPIEIPYNDGVNPPQTARAILYTNSQNHYPTGMYRLVVSGSGQVRLWGSANGTYQTPIDVLVPVNDNADRIIIEIDESLAEDPITDIKFILPDYVNTYQTQQFTNEILSFLSDFQSIRFMDWLETNDSDNINWSERTSENYFTQTKNTGVAWEYVIDLCNASQKDAWINIPHLANDDYIHQLALLFRDHLDPNLKVYLEYSNEIWNYSFSQFNEVAALGEAIGYTGQDGEQARKYTAKRSADIFYEFETAFGSDDRLVKVIPGRAAGGNTSNSILQYFNDAFYNPNQVTADALAIAPYFGNGVGNYIADNGLTESITIPEIIELMEDALLVAYERMDVNKTVADNFGLELMSYEAGQHLVASGSNTNNDVLTAKLIETNRAEAIGDMYCDYFDYWYDITQGGLMSIFSSHTLPNRYGSWGIKERMDDVNNPKYEALVNCIFDYNSLSVEDFDEFNITIYPNPTSTFFTIKSMNVINKTEIFDLHGKLILSTDKEKIDVDGFKSGVYILKIYTDNRYSIKKVIVH